jgi:hypothetical protein
MEILIQMIENKFEIIEKVKNDRSLTLVIFNERLNLMISLSFVIIHHNKEYVEYMKNRINNYLLK